MKAPTVCVIGAALSSLFLAVTPAFCQNTTFTYQARVLDNGTNFTGTGLFKFVLVTSTNTSQQATATANPPSGGFITIINVTFGGSGYVSAPAVSITGGGGSGAMATAQISGSGAVTNITVNNPGSGYSSTPTVTVAAPPANILFATWWSNDGTSVNGSEPATAVPVGVTNGLFTVVLGDTTLANMTAIPALLFTQPNLQLRIWFNDGVNGSVALSPVQNLTPTPYAVFATVANSASNLLGTLANGNLPASAAFSGTVTANAFAGNGAGVTNVNAATIGGLAAGNFWQTTGNSGTTAGPNFVGTADDQPLELHVSSQRAFRLEPTTTVPNVIGGYSGNVVDSGAQGATIGGGGVTNFINRVSATLGTIAGGSGNIIGANASDSTIAGGSLNTIQASAIYSVISGGFNNTNGGGNYGVVGGGYQNQVGGTNSVTVSLSSGDANGIAAGACNFIGRGAAASFIGGGENNQIQTNANYDTLAGGFVNHILGSAGYSTIGGGFANLILGGVSYSSIGGGYQNEVGYSGTTIGGGGVDGVNPNAGNKAYGTGSTIAGGVGNFTQSPAIDSAIAGGYANTVKGGGAYSTIGGGSSNTAGASYSAIAGGYVNTAAGSYSALGGGSSNSVSGLYSVIAGGYVNTVQAGGAYSALGGGFSNIVSGSYAAIPGGLQNTAAGDYSFAAGRFAKAPTRSFVWSTYPNTATPAYSDRFEVFGTNGFAVNYSSQTNTGFGSKWVAIGPTVPNQTIQTWTGAYLSDGGAWTPNSDRGRKQNFKPVDAKRVLEDVVALPIETWSYKAEPVSVRHLGPMAQDFHAAFGLNGEDDKHIADVDEGGVALAAIQGLNQKLEAKSQVLERRSKELEAENAELKARLEKLEQIILQPKPN